MTELLNGIPLLTGWAAPTAWALTVLVVTLLGWTRTRHLGAAGRAAVLGGGPVVGLASWVAVDVVWRPVADGLGWFVWLWVGIVALVVLQAVVVPRRSRAGRRRRRRLGGALGSLAAVAAVLVAALLAVNAHFGAYPTLGAALGLTVEPGTLADLPQSAPESTSSRPPGPLLASWTPPADLPATGQVVEQAIPASDPRFAPRPALVYLPPAYLTADRPLLPVLVLLAGQPGEPRDWFTAGNAQASLDAWAQRHHGLAPVVVVPDPLGSNTANPVCSDAHLGNVATYLQRDVPAWIEQNLQVDTDRSRWAIGGLSNGGTCALQVITRDPQAYHSALVLSGELHPTLGTPEETIAVAFGGDADAYADNDPLTLLGRRLYSGTAVLFSAGVDDETYLPAVQQLEAAAKAAGMTTELRTYPGGHMWSEWATAFADQLDWLGVRLGLTS